MKANVVVFIIFVIVSIYYFSSDASPFFSSQESKSNEETPEATAKVREEKLTTTISPARDLTGTWQGPAQWTNNVNNPACQYEGTLTIRFRQKGNVLVGDYSARITKTEQLISSVPCSPEGEQGTFPLTGKVSSSEFEFAVATILFSGTFTSDLMKGKLESCPNQECNDGSRAVGFKGEFSLMRKS